MLTGYPYTIHHRSHCMEKCLIYLLTFNKYRKQCVGQTFDTFHHRWNNVDLNLVNMLMTYASRNVCSDNFVLLNTVLFKWCLNKIYWQDQSKQPSSKRKLLERYLEKPWSFGLTIKERVCQFRCWFWSCLQKPVLFG